MVRCGLSLQRPPTLVSQTGVVQVVLRKVCLTSFTEKGISVMEGIKTLIRNIGITQQSPSVLSELAVLVSKVGGVENAVQGLSTFLPGKPAAAGHIITKLQTALNNHIDDVIPHGTALQDSINDQIDVTLNSNSTLATFRGLVQPLPSAMEMSTSRCQDT